MQTIQNQAATNLIVWTDAGFLALVDDAFADSARRSGAHLACRPGCNQCCTGIFAISLLDAHRLRQGYIHLHRTDPDRALRLLSRVHTFIERLSPTYPGSPETGLLSQDDASRQAFENFANDEVCPILDPATGTCDLYAARPMTCRVFGPPVRGEDGLGVCELCFQGASDEAVAAAEMFLPPAEIEQELTAPHGTATTTVAFAFLPAARASTTEAMLEG